uniref:Uncharacterized protein n=1 Tax=Lactuca sativa TaxID=4236 RepID=A0A9R1VCN3_LACSA|nr:hypothetical protein LSAT_V11C500265210 [Lactuca sativa]
MRNEPTTFDPIGLKELLFSVGDYRVCFDRKALCLVIGLRFGDYFYPSFGFVAFIERVFPFVPLSVSMCMDDLTNVLNNSLHQLSNEDVVRVSMLYMLEQGFLGKYMRQPVINERMWLVSNLQEFNRYPWRRLIWDFTYKQICTMFDKIYDHLNPNCVRIGSRHTYTLQEFIHAFKIFNTFPNSSIVGSPILGVIPWTVAYPRMRRLHALDCERIFDVTNPVAHEHAARLWIESVQWIDAAYYADV